MSNQHLTYGERSTIAILKRKNRSITHIAATLDRSAPTISREITRNSNPDGSYSAASAKKRATTRAAAASCRASRIAADCWEYVEKRLTEDQWSPEQIAGRMRRDGLRPISHEGIYRYILRDKAKGGSLHTHLRHKFRSYRRRSSPRERRGRIPNQRMIGTRPKVVEERTRFGDYEMDTVIGRPSGETLVTIVERRSRHTLVLKAADKSALAVTTAIVTALLPYRGSIHTLTYDNGKESERSGDGQERTRRAPLGVSETNQFANHALIDGVLGGTGYFANPYHSWERGLNENTNGLIRQYFPKRTDFGMVMESEVREVQDKLNNRPRKCLGWRTPNEIISDQAAIVALPS
jgi:IS30 family transposase